MIDGGSGNNGGQLERRTEMAMKLANIEVMLEALKTNLTEVSHQTAVNRSDIAVVSTEILKTNASTDLIKGRLFGFGPGDAGEFGRLREDMAGKMMTMQTTLTTQVSGLTGRAATVTLRALGAVAIALLGGLAGWVAQLLVTHGGH